MILMHLCMLSERYKKSIKISESKTNIANAQLSIVHILNI